LYYSSQFIVVYVRDRNIFPNLYKFSNFFQLCYLRGKEKNYPNFPTTDLKFTLPLLLHPDSQNSHFQTRSHFQNNEFNFNFQVRQAPKDPRFMVSLIHFCLSIFMSVISNFNIHYFTRFPFSHFPFAQLYNLPF